MKRLGGAAVALALLASAHAAVAQVQGAWTPTGFLLSPRELNGQVLLANGSVLAAGGLDENGTVLASAELYNAKKGLWASAGSMQAARYYAPAVVLANGKVLVEGGLGTGGAVLGGAELFNPKTKTWAPAGTMAVPRYGHSATLLPDGSVLVAGGCAASGCATTTATSEIYHPATNGWSSTGSLALARAYHGAVLLQSGHVLVVDGLAGSATSSAELYDPASGSWAAAASTTAARYQQGTTLLADGKVLVSGGVVVKYPLGSAELYDPASNSWAPAGALKTPRYAHTSTLLPDGTVLLAGGQGQATSCGKDCTGFIPTAAAEIYTESTNSFSTAASLPRALAYHATTLLAGGQALTAGGDGYNTTCCQVVNDAAFYTPLSLTFSAYSLNFGMLQTGVSSPPQSVTLTNVSTHPVTFNAIAASGDFGQSNTCPATLAAGQNCAVMVVFSPTAAGVRSGSVTLRDDSPGSATQSIALSGTGEALALGFSPAALNLGTVTAGSSTSATAMLTNDGAVPVTITGASISPKNKTFTQTNNCPVTLAVQQTCSFTVVFTPPDIFRYKATLSVTNSAGAAAALPLAGMGAD